jgi:DNA-binding CsgD family transcriptional regulator
MPLLPSPADLLEPIHGLWDRLADFDAAATDAALRLLLAETARLIAAQNAFWIGAVRLPADEQDSHQGWRPRVIQYLRRSPRDTRYAREAIREIARGGLPNRESAANAREAGRFRARRLGELELSPRDLAFCRGEHRKRGIHDVVWVAVPLSDDAESYYGFHRKTPRRRFTAREVRTAAYAMRGIRWFHRRLMLSHGLLVARAPLAPAERAVAALLLTPRSEKEIAAALDLTPATTHKYVTDVLRKFGVSGRAGLTALWLGAPAPDAPPSDPQG